MKEIINIKLENCKLDYFIQKYHFTNRDILLMEQLINKINEKIKITLYWKMENSKVYLIYTLGHEIDEIVTSEKKDENLFEYYMVDCLSQELLKKAYEKGEEIIREKTGFWIDNYYFIGNQGKTDTEFRKIEEIFDILEPEGITYNKSFVMIPAKTVALFADLANHKGQNVEKMCKNCPNPCKK